MAANITEFRLGDRCVVKSSKRVFAEEYVERGIPFFRSKDVIDKALGVFQCYDLFISERRYRELKDTHSSPSKGDILISSVGNRSGQSYVVKDEGDFYFKDGNIIWLSDFKELDPWCLSYWLKSDVGQHALSSVMIGSAQKALTIDSIRKLSVQLPTFADQRRIAEVLGTLDDKIELNRRMNETLEAMARAIFKSWFVDFDPVRAKMDGRQPEGMDATTAKLFPDGFEESELGPIPRGWRVDRIYAASEVIYGAPFASAKFNTDGIGKPLIRIRDLSNESPGIFTTEKHPNGYLVVPGDIVVGMDGEFRAHLWGGAESWLNQRVCVIKPKIGFSAPFILHSIVEPLAEVEATETATTVIHLGKNDIDRFRIIVPADPPLRAFGRLADPLFHRIVLNRQESRTIATLRDTLLPKLLSGEVRSNCAETLLGNFGLL